MPPPRSPPQSLRWLTWSSLGLGSKGLAQFVVLAVLSRYLTAEEFGVVTATLIVVGLGRAFSYASIGPALVQRVELRDAHVRSAFGLGTYMALGMIALLWMSAPATERFFEMAGLAQVLRALSLVFLLEAPGLVPEALLQRDLDLRGLALAESFSSLLAFVPVGAGLAIAGYGIWALVAAYVVQALVKTVMLMSARPHRRSLRLDRQATGDILFFSGGFLGARLCNYGASQGDNFVVGKWMSAADLGIYGRAYQLMAMPAMFLGEVIDRILFPLMARYQTDVDRLRLTYSRGVALTATIMAPAAALGIILAPEIVRVVLGPNWDDVIAPFQVLMAGLVFRTGYKIADSLARATGAVYARAWRQAIFAALVFLGAKLGTRWGVAGVSAGIVAALGANYAMMAWLSLGTTRLRWGRFAALHVRGLVLATAAGGLSLLIAVWLRDAGAGALIVLGAAGLLPCLLLAAVAWRRPAVLGPEGLWLVHKLAGRRVAERPATVSAEVTTHHETSLR